MFDASTREECVVARTTSNTPLQALVLLNDPIFVEAARAFAGRTLREGGSTPADRIVNVGGYQVGYVGDLLYPLGFELRRQADGSGRVLLLVQNTRNEDLVNLTVQLDRPGRPRPLPRERE